MSQPTSPIPIIDFAPFLHGTDTEKEDVARQLDEAFQEYGFVYLTGHGVDQKEVDEVFDVSKEFFALPLSTKMLAPHPPGGSHHRGYSAPGLEKVSQHTYDVSEIAKLREKPDHKESFESGNPADTTQPNIWPPAPSLPHIPFQATLTSFFATCTHLTHTLLTALTLSLHLPDPSYLSQTHSQSLFQLRLLHYPPLPTSTLKNNLADRITAHSDFGTLTLLFQHQIGGLEIQCPKTQGWVPVPPVQGAVVVNIGDLMARWSNERWRSTVHRVGVPEGFEGDVVPERYSVPFFATADAGAVVEALPGCWGVGRPKKFEAVTAGEYVRRRMEALYQQ